MKQNNIEHGFQEKLIHWISNTLLLVFISLSFNSCKENNGTCLKTFDDSLQVVNDVLSNKLDSFIEKQDVDYEQMLNLQLSAEDVQALFTNPAVAQLEFVYTNYSGMTWGLTANAVDMNGNRVAGINPVRLSNIGGTTMANAFRITKQNVFLSRGQVKGLLGQPRGNRDPINGPWSDIFFSPNQELRSVQGQYLFYQTYNFTGGTTERANPSPPAMPAFPCLAECDN